MAKRHIRSRIKLTSRSKLVSNVDPAQRVLPRRFPKYVRDEPGPGSKRGTKTYLK